MSVETLIQSAIVRLDMAVMTTRNCIIVALPVAAVTFAVIGLCRLAQGGGDLNG